MFHDEDQCSPITITNLYHIHIYLHVITIQKHQKEAHICSYGEPYINVYVLSEVKETYLVIYFIEMYLYYKYFQQQITANFSG